MPGTPDDACRPRCHYHDRQATIELYPYYVENPDEAARLALERVSAIAKNL